MRISSPLRRIPSVWLSVVVLAIAGVAFGPARGEIVINVDQGATQPVPIAIPAFDGAPVAADISRVITADLASSGLFRPLDPAGFPAPPEANVQPAFDAWKAIAAQGLLTGHVADDGDGRLRADFRLWDIYVGEQMLGLEFTSTPENWRRVAHKIADAVYEKITGQKGYFDTRVIFVAESGSRTKPVRRLEIMDQDGANPSYVPTDPSSLVFTPRFSANSQEVTYMALRPSGSTIDLLNIETGRQEALGHFPGMVFAPRFSPDGRKVAFSVETNGNSDIYVMDLASRAASRLTSDPAIDTSPSFSPDARQIVFNSDRGGSPQLYVMSASGGDSRRISFGPGRYTTPVWSPDGKLIAFTRQDGGQFHIGVMNPDGSNEHILTGSAMDEGPTWAPNSRVIMFSRNAGAGDHLWTVDVSGAHLSPAPYPLAASDPAWSPLLP